MNQPKDFTVPPRQFTPTQIGKLLEIRPKVNCECPNHLASLVSSLVAFENYSAMCRNRNQEDAEMHAILHAETAKARAIMEGALAILVKFEKIALD